MRKSLAVLACFLSLVVGISLGLNLGQAKFTNHLEADLAAERENPRVVSNFSPTWPGSQLDLPVFPTVSTEPIEPPLPDNVAGSDYDRGYQAAKSLYGRLYLYNNRVADTYYLVDDVAKQQGSSIPVGIDEFVDRVPPKPGDRVAVYADLDGRPRYVVVK